MKELTLYVAGNTADEATAGLLFDSAHAAELYAADEGFAHVYSFTATIDWSTIQVESDVSGEEW